MLTSSSSSSKPTLDVKFCPFCGALLCRRSSNPYGIPFGYCHRCGQETETVRRPNHTRITQTPTEWAAFVSAADRESVIAAKLKEDGDKILAAVTHGDLMIDLDHNFSFSPKTSRDKLRAIVATHEDALLHMRRVHESEIRSLQRQISTAQHLYETSQKDLAACEAKMVNLEERLRRSETEAASALDTAQAAAEAKWRHVMESDNFARVERERDAVTVWKSMLSTIDSAVQEFQSTLR